MISDLPVRFEIAVRQAASDVPFLFLLARKAAAERPSSITFVLLLTVYSVEIEGLCFNKGNKGH
jgi:hypothetical protein